MDWADGVATSWRPHAEPASPVVVSPLQRFGRPAIGGVSTEVLWEHEDGGETVDEIAEAFGLAPCAVRWALSFENSQRAA